MDTKVQRLRAELAAAVEEEKRAKSALGAPWPREVKVYVHGNFGESSRYDALLNEWGLHPDGDVARMLSHLGTEHEITYAVAEDGVGTVTHIDGQAVAQQEPF